MQNTNSPESGLPESGAVERAERMSAAAALLGALAVLSGAFGAHALESRLEAAGTVELWRTAVRYLAWHALALLALAALRPTSAARPVAWLFAIGSVLFSGSIFGLALGGPGSVLGPITPLGGLLLTGGWLWLARLGFGRALCARDV